jgi:hypothetical protein
MKKNKLVNDSLFWFPVINQTWWTIIALIVSVGNILLFCIIILCACIFNVAYFKFIYNKVLEWFYDGKNNIKI